MFRPAPYLAVIAILLPVALVVIASALRDETQQAPTWVPTLIVLFMLLYIPLLAVAWLFMRSVRLSISGIAVGRPFQRWREASWHDISRAERRFMFVHIYTHSGASIAFAPRLLMNGNILLTVMLQYLPPRILDGALRMEALDHLRIPETGVTGMLRARARNRWPLGGFSLSFVGVVGAVLAVVSIVEPFLIMKPLSIILCAVAVLVALLGVVIGVWFLQEVIVTQDGMTIIRPWRRSPEEVMWSEVRVLIHSKRWALLRFRLAQTGRTERVVRCIGPGVLRAPEALRMDAFIKQHCLQHGVVAYPRRGLF